MTVERVLLIVNRRAGTGYGPDFAERLRDSLQTALGPGLEVSLEQVTDHPEARLAARRFLAASERPAALLAGGGGGTLRAVIEGICDEFPAGGLPGPDRVRVSGLRMGSGNVVAKQFAIPRDPLEGLAALASSLRQDRTAPCCVMRCEIGGAEGPDVRHGVTMCGLGQFGRVPGDLARWHRRMPGTRRFLARIIRLERLNDVEYGLAMLARSGWAALRPESCERVEIVSSRNGQDPDTVHLLAGVVLNFPIKGVPFEPGTVIEDPAVTMYTVPYPGRLRSVLLLGFPRLARPRPARRIEQQEQVEIRLQSGGCFEFFLDEDPERAIGWLRIGVAGTLPFIPGPGYPDRK